MCCPREPWHDLHSKIDGPEAYDVLKNFEERWLKASKRSAARKLSKLSRSHNDSLLWINKIPDIIAIDDEIYSNDDDPERWDVQVSLPKGSINHCKINNSDIHGRALSKFHLESRFSDQLIRILSRVFQKIHGRPLVR
jgi:phosphatidylserine/phosphatidylglycerophosphate/cardiolipin synthase-like enzyme